MWVTSHKKFSKVKKKKAFAVEMMRIIYVHHTEFMVANKEKSHHKMLLFKYIHQLYLNGLAFSPFQFF